SPTRGDRMTATGQVPAQPMGLGAARTVSLDRPVQWLIAGVTALLVLFPVAPILYQAFLDKPLYEADRAFTASNFSRILSSAEFWSTVATTGVFAVATTVLSVAIGTALAVVLTRTDVPAKGLLSNVALVPFYVSPLVLAFAWAIV